MFYCDLDDVLADFRRGACRVHSKSVESCAPVWDFWEPWGINKTQFWRRIYEAGLGFYESIVPPCPWYEELWNELQQLGDPIVILSAAGPGSACWSGKRLWVNRYLGKDVPLIVVDSSKLKHGLAGERFALLDDKEETVFEFTKRGGHGFTFPQQWNRYREYTSNRMEIVKRDLAHWKGLVDEWKVQDEAALSLSDWGTTPESVKTP